MPLLQRRAAGRHQRAAADAGAQRPGGSMSGPAAPTMQAHAPGARHRAAGRRARLRRVAVGGVHADHAQDPDAAADAGAAGLSAAGSSVQKRSVRRSDGGGQPVRGALARGARDLAGGARIRSRRRRSRQEFRQVYRDFIETKQACGESIDGITYDKFSGKLRNEPAAADHALRLQDGEVPGLRQGRQGGAQGHAGHDVTAAAARRRGSATVKTAPGGPPTRISPPWSLTMRCTMARPRPVPRGLGREVGREQLGARLVAEAGAVVGDLELDAAVDDARGDADACRLPATASRAFSTRLMTTWVSCSLSASARRQIARRASSSSGGLAALVERERAVDDLV